MWLREVTGKPGSGGGLCHSPGSQGPIAICLQTQRLANPPQLLARANLPKTEAPGRHWEPEGFIGMGRGPCSFFLEQRDVSQLWCCCLEGEVGVWHINAFERFVAIFISCFAIWGPCDMLKKADGARQLPADHILVQMHPRTGSSRR